ncbi:MAG TPA: hypothetical protein VFW40_02650 [Capsulimonadaceae bacterium]|nr:hypothetical protein [Capsulimonadaceae bacterium]
MYLVISTWEALPGHEAEFDRVGPMMASILRKQPGVVLVEGIKSGNRHIAVHGYRDEAAYRAAVEDPNSEFVRAANSHGIEKSGRWIGSERGVSFPHL